MTGHTPYAEVDPDEQAAVLAAVLAAAVAAVATSHPPRSVRTLTRRFARLDTAVQDAETPIDAVRAVFDSIRAMLRHVPAADAEHAKDRIVQVGLGVYADLLTARMQRWQPPVEQDEVA